MSVVPRIVVCHGGASSLEEERDGPQRAAQAGVDVLRSGGTVLDAAVQACVVLEDDPRFNAGTGSNLRLDGKTIEMDASCMDHDGRFGAVCSLRRTKNPVLVAQAITRTPHVLLAGEGALRLARALGHPDHDPWTPKAQKKFDRLREQLRAVQLDPEDCAWTLPDLERHWNYEVPLRSLAGPGDTVGAIATDGERYAAALSTGGTTATLLGRVGDVPLPGCGLQVGPMGAVCCTGDGDDIARAQLASRVYRLLEAGLTAQQALRAGIDSLPISTAVGLLVLKGSEVAGGSNRSMAWAYQEEA